MTKVVIVDDEILIRIGIKSSLNWEEYGFEIVGQAENGIKALEVIEETHPDIVMTDIKMPKMDGLELISEIRSRYPGIKIIVLSCLNDIDYVKKAIKLGAEDYILKLSIEPDSLLDVLTKVKQLIESEPHIPSKSEQEKEFRVNNYIIKEDIYRKMIAGSVGAGQFARELSSLGTEIKSGAFFVLCCSIDDYSHAPARSKMDDQYLFKFSFINILEESLSNYYNCDIAEVDYGEYIILLKDEDMPSKAINKDKLDGCLKRINNSLKKYLNITISIGVDTNPVEYTGIRESYFKANIAMKYKFYNGRESIIFLDTVKNFINKSIAFDSSSEKILNEKLEYFEQRGVKEVIDTFFDKIAELKNFEPDAVRKVSVEIFNSLNNFIKKFDLKDDFIASAFSVHPFDFLMTAETIQDIKQWFSNFVDTIFDYIYSLQYEVKRPEIIKLQKYIQENTGENITLEKASKISNISKCYLSSIFKRETGEVFVDYVNKTKMEKAKVLIQQQGLKIYEAANMVGISDECYFSKLFKKYMGVSPSKFQRPDK